MEAEAAAAVSCLDQFDKNVKRDLNSQEKVRKKHETKLISEDVQMKETRDQPEETGQPATEEWENYQEQVDIEAKIYKSNEYPPRTLPIVRAGQPIVISVIFR